MLGTETGAELWTVLPDKLKETVLLYEQKARLPRLAFDLYARTLAPLYLANGQLAEAVSCLEAGWNISNVPSVSVAERISLIARIISWFEDRRDENMDRKRAFYLRLLSQMLVGTQEYRLALLMLFRTFPIYLYSCAWPNLRKKVLTEALSIADKLGQGDLFVRLGFHLLANGSALHKSSLPEEDQRKLYKRMSVMACQKDQGNSNLQIPIQILSEHTQPLTLPIIQSVKLR